MKFIKQNPYYVVGLLAGADEKKIASQKSKINRFLEVGKTIEFDTDTDLFGRPERSPDAVRRAFSGIETNQNKIFNSLYWFVCRDRFDSIALEHLRSGNIGKAEEIWEKASGGKILSEKNFNIFNNLGTLKLSIAFSSQRLKLEALRDGVWLKTELISSRYFNSFCDYIADKTYKVDRNKELETFIGALLEEVSRSERLEKREFISQIGDYHPKLQTLISKKIARDPLHDIEREIERAKNRQKNNPSESLKAGQSLYKATKNNLNNLSRVLGSSNPKYTTIANKLAKEILQCGIDYFHHRQNIGKRNDEGWAEDVLALFKLAQSTAAPEGIAKDRISENITALREWISNTPETKNKKQVEEESFPKSSQKSFSFSDRLLFILIIPVILIVGAVRLIVASISSGLLFILIVAYLLIASFFDLRPFSGNTSRNAPSDNQINLAHRTAVASSSIRKQWPVVTSPYRGNQLKNGSSPYNAYIGKGIYNHDHLNWVRVKNGDDFDAVVFLVDTNTGRNIRNEYIRAGSTFKMTNIPNGIYYMKAFFGRDWNPDITLNNGRINGGFGTDLHFSKSDSLGDYFFIEDDGYRYKTYEVTLYRNISSKTVLRWYRHRARWLSVSHVNMRQRAVDKNEFFK